MANSEDLFDKNQFNCPVCLDLLKDPVTIPCGHSYCMDCIEGCWDQEDRAGVYSCPQCRQTFNTRPVLGRNTILAEVLEKLKKTGLQAAPLDHCDAGPGDVECDVCTGRKLKAVKSCLVCLASYCETHLKVHNELNPGNRHKMTDATGQLQDKICSHHDKLLEVYCRTDQQCICLLCVMDEHRGHDTVSAAVGRTEKQKQLELTEKGFQRTIEEREKQLQELRQAVDSITHSAQAAVEDTEKIFTEMIRSIEKRRSELKDLIRAQEKAAVSWAESFLKQLEQEIAELRRRHSELEHISHTEDHIHFLQSLRVSPTSICLPTINPSSHSSFDMAHLTRLCNLNNQLEMFAKKVINVSQTVVSLVTKVHVNGVQEKQLRVLSSSVSPPLQSTYIDKVKTRDDFLQYATRLTPDHRMVHKHLRLSEWNTLVTRLEEPLPYPDHPERFDSWYQVLCREGLTRHHYWEVQWRGREVYIAVSYKGISRKGWGDDCHFGHNNKSWSLHCTSTGYAFYHSKEVTTVAISSSSRIGVYLDHRVGTLSFYSVSDTMTLLHRVQTTFTEPLYPGFWVAGQGSKVKLCSLT